MTEELDSDWQELAQNYKDLETANQIYQKKLKELTACQNACLSLITRQRNRLKAISKYARELGTEVSTDKQKEISEGSFQREAQLQIIEETLPKKSGRYLRVILGNIDVAFLSQEAKFKYKDEYEKFKLICHVIAFVLVLLNMTFSSRALEVIYLFFLVWYYCTISIRESILRANGSKIKTWWRIHHALSTLASGIMLVWPENEPWYQFKGQFLRYNMYNCLVQYLQFKYQRGALYRLKALGKKDNMDITIEGFQYWMWRGLTFLFPFLFIGYFYQLYNAFVLYRLSVHPEATWHVLASSILMFVFYLGNTCTTVMVVPNKIKNKMLVRYKVMTNRLYDVVSESIPLSKYDSKSN